ncbi:MAG TPA: hypothetical protein VK618_10715 [Flavitalea sp.]|nr:hypothetical protein [Flavitalea sp.]
MTDLIDKLKSQAGITEEQALKSIEVIKNYTKEKFPMFAGAIENLFKKYRPEDKDDFVD